MIHHEYLLQRSIINFRKKKKEKKKRKGIIDFRGQKGRQKEYNLIDSCYPQSHVVTLYASIKTILFLKK